jgi:hypothetical protein
MVPANDDLNGRRDGDGRGARQKFVAVAHAADVPQRLCSSNPAGICICFCFCA